MDAFTNCYNFSKRHEFTDQSISGMSYQNTRLSFILKILSRKRHMINLLKVLLAILNQVHEYACQTAFENTQESLHFSRELILFHAVLRPPFSIEVFTPNEAKLANQYMDENYFR